MSTDLYVAASAQVAINRRMEAIANNIANMNTAGFRATGVKFEQALSNGRRLGSVVRVGRHDLHQARCRARSPTPATASTSPIDGDSWLALETPAGTVYTRDGRMHLTDLGELRSVNDYPVLDPGGGPITVDPAGGPVTISENGGIIQGGKQISAIGMFLIPADANLTRYDNSAVIPDKPVEAVEDLTTNSMRQGYIEGSNVNPIIEMTRMIEVSRAFDKAARAIDESDYARSGSDPHAFADRIEPRA